MAEFQTGKTMVDPESGELIDTTEYFADMIVDLKERIDNRQATVDNMTELYAKAKIENQESREEESR